MLVFAPNVELKRWRASRGKPSAPPRSPLPVHIGVGSGCSLEFTLTEFILRPRGLVLYGATRLGKTVWARSLGAHSYFGGLFNMDLFSEDGRYAVFDDIAGGFGFFPSYKCWMGGQFEFSVTDKYRHKRNVRWGKPAIWLCNTDPRLDWYKPGSGPDFEWMEANCDFVELSRAIFHASTDTPQS